MNQGKQIRKRKEVVEVQQFAVFLHLVETLISPTLSHMFHWNLVSLITLLDFPSHVNKDYAYLLM